MRLYERAHAAVLYEFGLFSRNRFQRYHAALFRYRADANLYGRVLPLAPFAGTNRREITLDIQHQLAVLVLHEQCMN